MSYVLLLMLLVLMTMMMMMIVIVLAGNEKSVMRVIHSPVRQITSSRFSCARRRLLPVNHPRDFQPPFPADRFTANVNSEQC